MPNYQVTAPDGTNYDITTPDGVSEADVLAYVQGQHAQAPAAPAKAPIGANPFEQAQLNKQAGIGFGQGLVNSINPFSDENSNSVLSQTVKGMGQGFSDIGDLATGNYKDNASLPSVQNLKAKRASNDATRQDYEKVFLEGGANSPGGKFLGGFNALPPVALASSLVGKYVNPFIADKTGLNEEDVQIAEMALPFAMRPGKANIAGKIGETVSDAMQPPPPPTLPPNMTQFQPLLDAQGGMLSNFLAKKPNNLDSGLKANQAISAEYGKAKQVVNDAQKAASGFEIAAPDFLNNLEKSIATYEASAIGGKQQGAVSALKAIRDKITDKQSNYTDPSGAPNKGFTIDSGDLIRAKQAINQGLPDNGFLKAGDGSAISFKGYIDNILGNHAKDNPDFASNLEGYNAAATDIASRFTGNKALRPAWKPEDYTSWKAAQNNPSLPGYGDATLTRATGLLGKLNTNNGTGTVSAVIQALPENLRTPVMRDALVNAIKTQPSLGNIALQAATLHPVRAGGLLLEALKGGGKEAPLGLLSKNLKQIAKKNTERK